MHQVTPTEVADIVYIQTISQRKSFPKSHKANMSVNGIPLEMEIDTGTAVSIVSEATWEQQLNKPTLKPCSLVLKGYPDNPLEIMGCCDVQVYTGWQNHKAAGVNSVQGKRFVSTWKELARQNKIKLARNCLYYWCKNQPVQT